jgi:SsrA-binding protein
MAVGVAHPDRLDAEDAVLAHDARADPLPSADAWRGQDETRHPAMLRSCGAFSAMVDAKTKKSGEKIIVDNRRARFDYEIGDKYEGGLVLLGSEVKSMRAGKVDLVDAFASVDKGEVWLKQMYVAPFEMASAYPHEPRRARKVLLHGAEISAIDEAVGRGGLTVVPLRLYFKNGRVKVELAVVRGKKKADKRADIAKKTAEREARAAIGRAVRGKQD